jgi:hypothetical protein
MPLEHIREFRVARPDAREVEEDAKDSAGERPEAAPNDGD